MQFQAFSLGLGEQWERVKGAYAAANRALGDIVKVNRLLEIQLSIQSDALPGPLHRQSLRQSMLCSFAALPVP